MVLDVSAALSWMFEDERDPIALEMASIVARDGAMVPALFRWELQNALLGALRRKRLTKATVEGHLTDLDDLDLVVDTQALDLPHATGLALAERFGLTAYDASCLELAQRTGRLLMTRDERLRAGAETLHALWTPEPKRR